MKLAFVDVPIHFVADLTKQKANNTNNKDTLPFPPKGTNDLWESSRNMGNTDGKLFEGG